MAEIRTNQYNVLLIDFRYKNKRHVLSTGLKDTKPNHRLVSLKCKAVEYDIKLDKLDISRYFPQYKKESSNGNTLAEFFEYYKKEKSIRASSFSNLLWAWNEYINPYFGHYKLPDIVKHEILVFRNSVNARLKVSSTKSVMTHLAGIMTRAHEEGLIVNYPMKKLGVLQSDTEPIDPFSFDELKHFIDFLTKGNYPEADMVYIWSRCGFRQGEILAQKWDDLDYYKLQINVLRTLVNSGVENPPKTANSKRTLTIRPDVIAAYKRQEKRSRMLGEYIFPNSVTGQRYNFPITFWKRFKYLLNLSGVKYRSPNQLRHTFATLHIAAGENITWVSKMLGHSDVSTTLKRYNKFIPDLTREDGSAFEKAYKDRQNGYSLVTVEDK
jgi:integrase